MKVNLFSLSVALNFTDYLIGGSYVVNPDTANDIDVLVHEHLHTNKLHNHLLGLGFRNLREGEGDEKYDEIDHMRLIDVYEGLVDGEKCNVIVVGATFWPAYQGAVASMRNDPELYATRDARIELHRSLSRQVAAIAKVELPDEAY